MGIKSRIELSNAQPRSPRRFASQAAAHAIFRPTRHPGSSEIARLPAAADLLPDRAFPSHSAVVDADRWPDETAISAAGDETKVSLGRASEWRRGRGFEPSIRLPV